LPSEFWVWVSLRISTWRLQRPSAMLRARIQRHGLGFTAYRGSLDVAAWVCASG
jgi:hypothetical protein